MSHSRVTLLEVFAINLGALLTSKEALVDVVSQVAAIAEEVIVIARIIMAIFFM